MGAYSIKYELFRIRVYSPDGVYLKDTSINKQGLFYCPGLIPGHTYNLVFTYDKTLILCLSFTCSTRGRVILINPAHILYNCALVRPGYGFISVMLEIIKGGDEMEIVGLGFEKRILMILRNSGTVNVDEYFRRYGFYMFRAGEDLQSSFKQNKKVV